MRVFFPQGEHILITVISLDVTIPRSRRAKSEVTLEARVYMLLYASLIAAGTMFPAFGAALMNYWVIPSVMGQPFLRFYLFAEHRGCEDNPSSVLKNTRTMKTNWLYRKLAWEMPYHMEHHCQLPHLCTSLLQSFYSLPASRS